MRMKTLRYVILVMLAMVVASAFARADSPVTSTHFYKAYMDIEMVRKAEQEGVISMEIAKYLSAPENSIDVKAAVVNAIGWIFGGKDNASIYKKYLADFHKMKVQKLDLNKLTGDEIFCLGYLTVLDDYFSPEKAIPLLEKARKKNPKSFTVAMILAITKAQEMGFAEWCKIYLYAAEVVNNKALKQDMRPEAVQIIMEYMGLYQSYCKG